MKIEERINCFVKLGRTFDQDFSVKNQEKLKIAEQLNPGLLRILLVMQLIHGNLV